MSTQIDTLLRATYPNELSGESCDPKPDLIDQFKAHYSKRARLDESHYRNKVIQEGLHQGVLAAHWQHTQWHYDAPQATIDWCMGNHKELWLRQLCDVFDCWEAAPHHPSFDKDASFAPALIPFLNYAWRQLNTSDDCKRVDLIRLKPQLLDDLCQQLTRLCHRVLVLELNVARLEEKLKGDTPHQRFLDFRNRILGTIEGWQRLFSEYQVLARLVSETLIRWVTNAQLLIDRVKTDLHQLDAGLLAECPGAQWTHARGGASDLHCGGQSVWMLGFENAQGARTQLVYKPKSLAIDHQFHKLLQWINDSATSKDVDRPLFVYPDVIDRGEYGWCSFVSRQETTNRGITQFYWRQGAYLALLYLLGATDFHHENLIAHGSYPVLVDLETLLHPSPEYAPSKTARDHAYSWLSQSVLQTGMLPRRVWGGAKQAGVHLGGLGSAEAQTLPSAVPDWAGSGTDEMRQIRVEKELQRSDNLPSKDGEAISVTDHVGDLIQGFTWMYRFISTQKNELGQLLRGFKGVKTRVVLRGTKIYSNLLYDGLHPDHMRHGFDRDNLFDHLWKSNGPSLIHQSIVPHEKSDLRSGDVPFFWTRTDEISLRDSRGNHVCDLDHISAFDHMMHRLNAMSDSDMQDQCFVIQGTVGSIMTQHQSGNVSNTNKQRDDITQQLMRSVFLGQEDAAWLSMDILPDGAWTFNPTGSDLYGGNGGIGWFLSVIQHKNNDPKIRDVTHRIFRELRQNIDVHEFAVHGGYSGTCSMYYAMVQMAAHDPSLGDLPAFTENMKYLADNVSEDGFFDIIAGAAGTLMHACAIHARCPSDSAVHLIIACSRHLVSSAVKHDDGCFWPFSKSPAGLLGFSHGNAGIACALARAADTLDRIGGHSYLVGLIEETVVRALTYERSHFNAKLGNWPDLRELGSGPHYESQWCHGAPGVGLGRALMPNRYRDDPTRQEIRVALNNTLARGAIGNHSLCHGILGNLWVAELLMKSLDPSDLVNQGVQDTLYRWELMARQQIEQSGPRCGIDVPIMIPGLMCGLAGIGLALEHLSYSQPICNPLALAYPESC